MLCRDVSRRPRLALGPETHWPFEMAQAGTAMATFSFNGLDVGRSAPTRARSGGRSKHAVRPRRSTGPGRGRQEMAPVVGHRGLSASKHWLTPVNLRSLASALFQGGSRFFPISSTL